MSRISVCYFGKTGLITEGGADEPNTKTVLCALVTTMAAPVALAEGMQIEEVIVTADRQEASIQDTSISITALTYDFIDDFGIRNQEDLQNFVPATTIQP